MSRLEAKGNEEILDHVSAYSFWGKERSGKFTSVELREQLREESEMWIPSAIETGKLQEKYADGLSKLNKEIKLNGHGLFLDRESQSLFVIKKNTKGSLEFMKAYPVVTSHEDWNNKAGTRGTPTGLDTVKMVREGFLGEVLSTLNRHADDREHFESIRVNDKGKSRIATVVKGFTLETQPIPEVITMAFLLDGERGIWIHGAPRKGLSTIPSAERREKAGSSGCIRASNVDVIDMAQYVTVGTPIYIYGKNPERAPDLDWFKFKD